MGRVIALNSKKTGTIPAKLYFEAIMEADMRIKLQAVNSISISGMLTPSHSLGQKVKPRWPPTEENLGRQVQSS